MTFLNRTDAALQLAEVFKTMKLSDPIVLGIPRGGLVVASVLAEQIGAELDVVLSRKLPTPGHPELAMGAIAEGGDIVWNEEVTQSLQLTPHEVESACNRESQEIERRRATYRKNRPAPRISGRSVIVTDDGIATGATIIAALQTLRHDQPKELIIAVPVAATSRLNEVQRWCDRAICLHHTDQFYAVGQFYQDFRQVGDGEVVMLLENSIQRRLEQSSQA